MFIHHYTTAGEAIDAAGEIYTEQQAMITRKAKGFTDSYDMDYVWLTANDFMAHAAHNYILGVVSRVALLANDYGTIDEGLVAWAMKSHSEGMRNWKRYTFDSKEVGAHPWRAERKRWVGNSIKRQNFAASIDNKSKINGDNPNEYYVSKRNLSINEAVAVEEVEIDPTTIHFALGGTDNFYKDFWRWKDRLG